VPRGGAKINWANHVDFHLQLIRGCNPAPGAWTTISGKKLQIFDSRKHLVRTFGAVKGKVGEVSEIGPSSFFRDPRAADRGAKESTRTARRSRPPNSSPRTGIVRAPARRLTPPACHPPCSGGASCFASVKCPSSWI